MNKVLKKNNCFYYDIICIVDFEATCDVTNSETKIQEIIEFPAVMVDVRQKQIVIH